MPSWRDHAPDTPVSEYSTPQVVFNLQATESSFPGQRPEASLFQKFSFSNNFLVNASLSLFYLSSFWLLYCLSLAISHLVRYSRSRKSGSETD